MRVSVVLAALFVRLAFGCQATDPVSGRTIAPVMSANGADWLDRPERAAEEQPDKALDALNLKKGMVVADIGAGTGYMTLRMARRVGPEGKVYAVDVQTEMIRRLRVNALKAGMENVETILGSDGDPKLPAGKLDLALMVDVYHELQQPQSMLRALRAALKDDGQLVLLEYRKEDPKVPIQALHKMSVAGVRLELEAEEFRLAQTIETLPRQHILIFVKATGDRPPR